MGRLPWMKFTPHEWAVDLDEHSLEIEGAWIRICGRLHQNESDRGRLTKTLAQWARLLRVETDKAREILTYIKGEKIGDVEGLSLDCPAAVPDLSPTCPADVPEITVICRRMVREQKDRDKEREKKRLQRDVARKKRTEGETPSELSPDCPSTVPDLSLTCPAAVPDLSPTCPADVPEITVICRRMVREQKDRDKEREKKRLQRDVARKKRTEGETPSELSPDCPSTVPDLSLTCPSDVPEMSPNCPADVPGRLKTRDIEEDSRERLELEEEEKKITCDREAASPGAKKKTRRGKSKSPPLKKEHQRIFVETYNEIVGNALPQITEWPLDPEFIRLLKARMKERGWLTNWKGALDRARESEYLTERHNDGNGMTCWFFIRRGTVQKIMDGEYGCKEAVDPEDDLRRFAERMDGAHA